MSLYKYRKVQSYVQENGGNIVINESQERLTIWKIIGNIYTSIEKAATSSLLANIVIPTLFIIIGVFLIWKYFYPEIRSLIEQSTGLTDQGTTALAANDFLDRSKYISNPEGLADLSSTALGENVLQADEVSNNFNGTFYITIPSLNINSLPVKANVESTSENVYNQVLKTQLAHFSGTGLPISDVQNNIVIYGHSASPNYYPQTSDPEVAFSFLPNLKVGDMIYIDVNGERFSYRMFRSKIVEPNDISIITGTRNQRTLTLFTCYPAGNNSSRYIAVARPA